MFKDIELSREEMVSYKARQDENVTGKPIDLYVNVLSASAWPSYPDIPLTIPAAVKSALDRFEGSYKNSHNGRKLSWKHGLAHCQLVARFPKGTKELVVSGFQAIVLLLFGHVSLKDELSYEQIKAETGLRMFHQQCVEKFTDSAQPKTN
jgi:cullin-4